MNKLAKQNNKIELLSDEKYIDGFQLLSTSTENKRNISGWIINNGKEALRLPKWQMAQWWTHNDFIKSNYIQISDTKYQYKNDSRTLILDEDKGELTMELNSYVEYMHKLGHSRTGNEGWSHFLIEQSFEKAAKLVDCEKIIVTFDFKINECTNLDLFQLIPAASFLFYMTITHPKNGDTAYQSGENDNDFFWFGLPIFDSREDYVKGYYHVDSGFTGATNKLIYSIPGTKFLKEKIQYGKQYHVEIDILPYLHEAYKFGKENGALKNSSFEDLVVNYMNLGWELPGSFKVSSTISNLQISIIKKRCKHEEKNTKCAMRDYNDTNFR